MKLENQVCSITQAKMLKELGVCQDSYLYHVNSISTPCTLSPKEKIIFNQYWAAFTVAELGAMLPKRLKASWKHSDSTGLGGTWESSCDTRIEFDYDEKKGMFIVRYPLVSRFAHKNEAIARAEMILSLLTKKLISVVEINKNFQAA